MACDVAAVVADAREGAAPDALAATLRHQVRSCSNPGGGELMGVGALRAAKALADAHGLCFQLLNAPAWLERSVLGRRACSSEAQLVPANTSRWRPAHSSAGASQRTTKQPGSACSSRFQGSAVRGRGLQRGLAWSGWVPWGLSPSTGPWMPAGLSASPGALGQGLGLGPAGRAMAMAGIAACCACAWGLAAVGLALGALCRTAW